MGAISKGAKSFHQEGWLIVTSEKPSIRLFTSLNKPRLSLCYNP